MSLAGDFGHYAALIRDGVFSSFPPKNASPNGGISIDHTWPINLLRPSAIVGVSFSVPFMHAESLNDGLNND